MSNDRPSEFDGRIAPDKDWRAIVALIGDIPPMPNVAQQAIAKIEDPNINAADLANLLSNDAALAARILKISNSSMFCRQREITTLNQSIMIIGFKALKGIIVAAALQQMKKKPGPTDRLVWEHSLATAMAATSIAKKLGKRYVDEVFLLGLLHSLGHVVFLSQKELAKDFGLLLDKIRDEHSSYVDAEQKHFGFAHPLLGALIGKKWNFPADVCQVILHYADPYEEIDLTNDIGERCLLIQLAELVAHAAGLGSPEGYPDSIEKIQKVAIILGYSESNIASEIEELVNSTRQHYEKESSIYS